MFKKPVDQTIITIASQDDYIPRWIESFLIDRKSEGLSPHTVKYYRVELARFTQYCDAQVIERISQVTPDIIRRYLLWLEDIGRNPGGINSCYRALRAFLLWWEAEVEPDAWKNPIHKVKAPKVTSEPIEPVELDTIQALLDTCNGGTFTDIRDRALLMFLLDTGARAAETCAVDIADVDNTGAVLIRKGKGDKYRDVFLGQKARRALRAYMHRRKDGSQALFTGNNGDRLNYWGLNSIIRRRAKQAKVKKPGLHDFRRAFALNFLRNNPGDIYSLQKLGGWADLQIVRRYLAQTKEDLRAAHGRGSPVDYSGIR